MPYKIPLSYNPIDISKLAEVLIQYEGMHHNQIVTDFETALQKTTGAPFVVALNSGTSAIHLALKVLGVGAEDIVIVPAFTYVASVNPVRYLGAVPVFIDSEAETWNMDPNLLEKAIKDLSRLNRIPKAIILVHTYGMPSKMEDIMRLAEHYNIPIIEDAAESIGSRYRNQQVGTFGDIGIYSFNNNKVLTTYGGGAFITKKADLAQKARYFASQAREPLPYYEHKEVGYNYAMSPLCAASGLSQLPELSTRINERRRIFENYRMSFQEYEVQLQPENESNYSNRWFTALLFKDEATRKMISSVLQQAGAETRPLWNPINQQPVYQQFTGVLNDTANQFFKRGLCLPSSSGMTSEEQQILTELIRKNL
ncbi:MAG TPA: DegT/DnrJ/EryC1/StrS family aminotransferase [Cyclobacteriaceae bacterium]|nr:DegT/DnrJ/EryC1/StrS family aminotransferase [Cyclobacteriaceae bacterium]